MIDRIFLGTVLLLLFFMGCLLLCQRVKLEELKKSQAVLLDKIEQVEKKQRVNAQDIDFMRKLITGYEFWEVEDD